jgi:hypothetical protein
MQRGAVRWCPPNGGHTIPHARRITVAGRFASKSRPSRTFPQTYPHPRHAAMKRDLARLPEAALIALFGVVA